eukprot:TRINITY_DN2851_c0_g1_i1.p1 TRINITY_DN2851_c0_g1~~TRINITY_DN2851_c0_g1_i1.p1  ORF type:complete len:789 (+),score=145.29 TRINITY_DN2851_c0_g1_i1:40-2406(+)
MAPAVSRRQPGAAPPSSERKAGACGSATSPAQAKQSSAAARFAPATGKALAAGKAKAQPQGPGRSQVKSRFTQPKEENVSLEEKPPDRRVGNVVVSQEGAAQVSATADVSTQQARSAAKGVVTLPKPGGIVTPPKPGGPPNIIPPQEQERAGGLESSLTTGGSEDEAPLGATLRRPQEQQKLAKPADGVSPREPEKNEALEDLAKLNELGEQDALKDLAELSKLQGKLRKLTEELDGENKEIERTMIEIQSPRSARTANGRGSSPPSLAEPAAEPEAVILADSRSPNSGKDDQDQDRSSQGERSPWGTFREADKSSPRIARQQSPAVSEELAFPGREKKLLTLQTEVKYQEDRITKLEEALRNAYERSVAHSGGGAEASEKQEDASPNAQGLAPQGVQTAPCPASVAAQRHPPVAAWTTISLATLPSQPKAQGQWQDPRTPWNATRSGSPAAEQRGPVPAKSNRELLQEMQDNLQKCLQAGNSTSSRPATAPRFVQRVSGAMSPPVSPRVMMAPQANVVVWKYGGVTQAVEVSNPCAPVTLLSSPAQCQQFASRWVRLDASAKVQHQPVGAASPSLPSAGAAWRPLPEQTAAWRLSPVSTPCATPSSPGAPPHLAVSTTGAVRQSSPRPQATCSARAASSMARGAAAPVTSAAGLSRLDLNSVSCTSAVSTGSATLRLAGTAGLVQGSAPAVCTSGTTSPVPPGGLPWREAHIATRPASTSGTPVMLASTPRVLPPKRVTAASTPPVPPKDGPHAIREPATAATSLIGGRFIPARTPPAGGAPGASMC